MSADSYSISTKAVQIPAGAHPAIVAGFVGLGKQANRFDPTKPPQLRFTLVYRMLLESETTVWCKSYSATWGPKSALFKDCGMLYTAEEIKAGQIAPTQLLGRPCQLLFTTSRDEAGAEKTVLAAVGALPKNAANQEAVKQLREAGSFSFDAGKGERPSLDVLNVLPKWLLEMVEQAGPVQAAAAPASNWTAPNPNPQPQPATASPTAAFLAGGTPHPEPQQQKTAQPATAEPFDDDVPW